MMKWKMTRLAEVTDGLSQTIAVIESAGRDARFLSAYSESYFTPGIERTARCPPARAGFGGGPSPTARSCLRP